MAKGQQRKRSNDSDDESEIETRCQICWRIFIKGLKRFIMFLFSHVGLTSVVVGYTIIGGLLFQALELPEEELTRQAVIDVQNEYTDRIAKFLDVSEIEQVLDKKAWNEKVDQLLKEYQTEIFGITKERNWDGRIEGDDYQWSFAESLLYSVTVISTIGYGNITPKTWYGRVLTILYGIIGIPLTMLCLRNIGILMAGCFRLIYRGACVNMTYQYIKLKRRRLRQKFLKKFKGKTKIMRNWARKTHSSVSSILHISNIALNQSDDGSGIGVDKTLGSQTHIDSQQAAEINESLVKNYKEAKRRHSVNIIRNIDLQNDSRKLSLTTRAHNTILCTNLSMSGDLTVIPEENIMALTYDDVPERTIKHSKSDSDLVSLSASTISLHDFEEDERILKARLKATRNLVPISVCLLLVTGYIILGAFLFSSWEESWNFLVGFYFCFITLTTIGFGDFVPGTGRLNNDSTLVFCVIYLVFGMALLAMSFDLIQEEVRHKCRKLAVRIGLVEEKLTQMLDNINDKN